MPGCVFNALGFAGAFILIALVLTLVAAIVFLIVVWQRRDDLENGSITFLRPGFSFTLKPRTNQRDSDED